MKALTDQYLEKFERFDKTGAAQLPTWLFPIRKAAIAHFAQVGLPTTQLEDWRFTSMQGIAALPFRPVFEYRPGQVTSADLAGRPLSQLAGPKLVFVNGHFAPELSSIGSLPAGVVISSLANALELRPEVLQTHLTQHYRIDATPFSALNAAYFQDGAFLSVPAGITIAEPVQLIHLAAGTERGSTAHPRHLVVLGDRSQLTIIESYYSIDGPATFTNSVSEFVVGEGATLEHCKFQNEATDAFHMAGLHMHIQARAQVLSHSIVTGAKLSRNNIRTALMGPGIEAILNGLYITTDDQLVDHHMVVDHAQPSCASHEYFNGILAGRSRGVFHGRILVRKGAQKTDAKQTNKNLLLSDDATIDTKPQLEIYADDVKCTHGATIGQLNEESIFYLRARGIGADMARRMLIHAFAGEIIDRIKCSEVREEIDRLVWDRLEQNEEVCVTNSGAGPATAPQPPPLVTKAVPRREERQAHV